MKIAIFIILALLVVILAFLWYIFDIAFFNPRSKRTKKSEGLQGEQYEKLKEELKALSHNLKKEEYEAVEITSYDGLKLRGKYYHYHDDAPLEIILHGYRSNPYNDCGGGFKLSKESGYNVLLPDHRAHGESEGSVITFGVKERYDCLSWINYVVQRNKNVKIFISGVSMGASTVLMASDLPLPENVKGIIADCPYSSPEEIIVDVSEKMGYPKGLAAPFIRLSARIMAGISLNKVTALNSVKNTALPILIIHGEDDRFVPCEMGKRIYNECNSRKMLFTVKDAGHGLSFLIDENGYKKAVKCFKEGALNNDFSEFE